MFDTIYIPASYAEYDKTGITEFLNRMAAKGWILSSKKGELYKFVKTDKTYFRYDITYFADADETNNYYIVGSMDYYEMRKAGGWQFLTNDRKMQIFISENPDAVPLDTDPLTQVQVIHQSAIGLIGLQVFIGVTQIINNIRPSEYHPLTDLLLLICGICFVADGLFYCLWYRKALKQAKEYNSFYETGTNILMKYVVPISLLGAITAIFKGW